MTEPLDRFVGHAELTSWIHDVAAQHPELVTLDSYGASYEGRELWLVTITDSSTGGHETKPAHWVDASIHAVELTATVAACALITRLVSGFGTDDRVTTALRTRTFYIVPRVNPDGAEAVLAAQPRWPRSSMRSWPWTDGHRWPGLDRHDIDGDGRILQMRIPDHNGGWIAHPENERLLVPVPADGVVPEGERYRLLVEGTVNDHDGFTIPTPRPSEGLDLNRNFPAGWSTEVTGAGDHPLSEPEIDALVRAIAARPNICGTNAFHTSGGVLLRPSSTRADSKLPPLDVWTWNQLAEVGTELTGYPAHSVFEDFTWDQSDTMSGAADDWSYEHLGVFSWTTEFWDVVHAATGAKQSTHFWYTGPTPEEALAVLRWCEEHHPDGYVDWYEFDHPQLGRIELGGWDDLTTWTNPPPSRLLDEVAPHADFAIHQALCAPELAIEHVVTESLGGDTWRIVVGVANTGWLPTDVSALARKASLVKPVTVEIDGAGETVEVLDGPARHAIGQLEGRAALRFRHGNDGTPDRAITSWVVRAKAGDSVRIVAAHARAGSVETVVELA